MKNATSTAVLAAAILASSGITVAGDRDSSAAAPIDKTTTAESPNKLQEQDLSDKDMQTSQSGADTKIIQMGFKRLDSNDDSFITSDEASMQPPLDTQFKTVDKNGDQKLDMNEFARFTEANGESMQTEQDKTPQ